MITMKSDLEQAKDLLAEISALEDKALNLAMGIGGLLGAKIGVVYYRLGDVKDSLSWEIRKYVEGGGE